jgi:hypothetical protein
MTAEIAEGQVCAAAGCCRGSMQLSYGRMSCVRLSTQVQRQLTRFRFSNKRRALVQPLACGSTTVLDRPIEPLAESMATADLQAAQHANHCFAIFACASSSREHTATGATESQPHHKHMHAAAET